MTDQTKSDGGPAFPFGQVSEASGQPINGYHNDGMSLRDYFAAKALSGLLADPTVRPQKDKTVEHFYKEAAAGAYMAADAMLAAREARPC